jgi:hypothetical protein
MGRENSWPGASTSFFEKPKTFSQMLAARNVIVHWHSESRSTLCLLISTGTWRFFNAQMTAPLGQANNHAR